MCWSEAIWSAADACDAQVKSYDSGLVAVSSWSHLMTLL